MINSKTKIFLTNLGKYNEGELVGKWLDVPFTDEELENVLKEIGIDGEEYEEYFISDYETNISYLEIDEYENLDELNNLIYEYEQLNDYEAMKISAMMEISNYDLYEAINKLNDFDFYPDIKNDYDLGYYWAVESGCYNIDDNNPLFNYIDYEAFGRDIRLENGGHYTNYGYIQ